MDLVVVKLEKTWVNVQRVPLVYSGLVLRADFLNTEDISLIEIFMKQNPQEEYVIAVKIGIQIAG